MSRLLASNATCQAPAIATLRRVAPAPRPAPRSWTWAKLADVEPRLLAVAWWAAQTSFSWTAYEALKTRMEPFVGSTAQQPELRSIAAWNAAGQHLIDCMQRGQIGCTGGPRR